ncbi:MAG: T9SS type A sorting domain-containing protein [Bacteroidales bacterium]|nr:T9SS type A sorting domain-containing protein [Bacteroidales bacterium]
MVDMLNTVSLSPANPVVPSVTITASPATAVPPATSVTFSPTPVNGGTPSYQWFVNGVPDYVNGLEATYTYTPVNGDQVYCEMYPSLTCVSPLFGTSNTITMFVGTIDPPTAFNVTGGGNYCQGGAGVPVGLFDSELNVTYTLFLDGVAQTPTVAGTGSAISFGNQLAGVYTVSGTNLGGTTVMTGSVTVVEDLPVPVSVSILESANPICDGGSVTFTATPTNGGTAAYQWYVNANPVGTNLDTYAYTPANNDQVYVIMTSGLTCVSGSPATSNTITMSVIAITPVSVVVAADQNPACVGNTVNFTATPTNGGAAPTYQWYVNGIAAGTGLDTYSYAPADADEVYVVMTSNFGSCLSNNPATSNTVTMSMSPSGVASVLIAASENPSCDGSSVTFTATPSFGGIPTYQWYVNATPVGTNLDTYSYIPLAGDQVYVVMTSSLTCASGSPATSNTITMATTAPVTVSVTIAASENPSCAGASVTFTATPVNGGTTPTYQWYVNSIAVGTNLDTYSYVPANNDQVYVEITTSLTCVVAATANSNTITMGVLPLVPLSVTIGESANSVCAGTSVLFTAIIGGGGTKAPSDYSYQWYVNGTTVGINQDTYSYAPANNDEVYVIVTSSIPCATGTPATSNTITMTVIAIEPVSVSILPSANPVCAGSDVTLTATPVNGGVPAYQWYLNGSPTGTGLATYTYTPTDNDQVYVIMTSDLPCTSGNPATSNTVIIAVSSSVVASVTINPDANPVCAGTPVTYTATPTNGGTPSYQWYLNSNPVGLNQDTYNFTPVNNDQVYVVMTSSIGCATGSPASSAVSTMGVNALPVPGIAGPVSVCATGTGNVYSTEAGMTGYTWSISAGGTITAGGTTTDNTVTVTWNVAGPQTVSVSYTDANSCVAAVPSIYNVTVNPLPVPVITGSASVCLNSTTVYSTEAGMTGYSWVVSAGGTITAGGTATDNTVTINWTALGAQTVSVGYTNGNSCTSALPTVYNVTVNALPVPTISGLASVCASGTAIYTTEAGMTGYTWNISAGGTITAGAGTNAITVTWNTAGAQTVSVNYTNANSCTAPSATVYNVTVNALPVPTITGPSPVCASSTGNVYTTEAGMTGYTWTVSAGGTITAGAGTDAITVTWNTAGAQTVSVNYTNGNSCTAASATVKNVTVNAQPVPTITGTTPAGVGTSHVYTTEAGMTNYVWTVSAGGTITAGGTSTSNTVTILWNIAGAETVTVNYNNANGCNATTATSYPVTVISIPPTAGSITGTSTVCQGTMGVAYSVAPIPNATGYVWNLPAGATIATGANTNSITVDFGYTAVSGNITVYGTNIYGNGGLSPAYAVTVNAAPVPTISGPASICSSATGNVYTTQAGMTAYVWAVSAGGTITAGGTATDNTVTVSWTGSGAQTVSVSYTNGNGCTAATPTVYNVSVGALPVPTITGDNAVCEDSDYYTYTTEPGMTNYVWAMSPGSGTMTWVTGSNEVMIFWTTSGAKFVSVSYTNASGCSAAAPTVFNVTVSPVPSAAGTITGTTTLCQGTSGVTYTTTAISGATYSWTVPTGATIVTGATTTSITVDYGSTAVSGLVTVAGSNACGLGTSSSLSVTVNPIPATPTITRVGYILTSSSPAGNQWYKDGVLITGATAQTYEVLETGTYSVVVTLSGCTSESSEGLLVVYTVGVNELVKLQKVEVYPNPNDGQFTLGVTSSSREMFDIRIMSNLGVVVYERKGVEVDGSLKQEIDLSRMPKGIYSVVLLSGNTQIIRKVVIN